MSAKDKQNGSDSNERMNKALRQFLDEHDPDRALGKNVSPKPMDPNAKGAIHPDKTTPPVTDPNPGLKDSPGNYLNPNASPRHKEEYEGLLQEPEKSSPSPQKPVPDYMPYIRRLDQLPGPPPPADPSSKMYKAGDELPSPRTPAQPQMAEKSNGRGGVA